MRLHPIALAHHLRCRHTLSRPLEATSMAETDCKHAGGEANPCSLRLGHWRERGVLQMNLSSSLGADGASTLTVFVGGW
jgi:hypothetical protein